MKIIEKTEAYFPCDGDMSISGPSVALCPRKGIPGEGDMALTFDLMDRKKSNLTTSIYRSGDGGQTWKFQSVFEHKFVYDMKGSSRRDGYGSVFSDVAHGVMLYFGTELYFEHDDPSSPYNKRKIYYRISFDNGYTWSDKRQIIQKGINSAGQMYNKTNFMDGVKFGCNMANFVVPNCVMTQDSAITLGVCSQAVDSKWRKIDYTGEGFMRAGVVKAVWNAADLAYDFTFGSWAAAEAEHSTRGIFEPTLAMVNGERLMMVTRGSNASSSKTAGSKFFLLSNDCGLTWSHPEPLLYDDGSVMYSSSSRPVLFAHSCGRLFYVGVINSSNPSGNFPRYPLCIAEVDKYSCRVKRRSVLKIADKPVGVRQKGAKYPVDFTGHWAYEDRGGNIVILVPNRPDLDKFGRQLDRYVLAL